MCKKGLTAYAILLSSMILAGIVTGIIVAAANAAVFLLLLRRLQAEKSALLQTIQLYFEADKDKQSEFANLIDQVSSRFGFHVAQSLKATFMAHQSAESKNVSKVEAAITSDLISQKSPLLGAIANSFPAVSKLLAKNQNLMPLVEQYLGRSKSGGNGEEMPLQVDLTKY